MKNIRDFTLQELEEEMMAIGEKKYRAKQVFAWLFKHVKSFDEMTDLSKEVIYKLKENYILNLIELEDLQESTDGTIKYLFRLNDETKIESVLMKYKYGYIACVSNQVGCKMGCNFCASARIGFIRSLTSRRNNFSNTKN